jgi:hypothetical protein
MSGCRRADPRSSARRWAGMQDSMPRAAVLSMHARVAGTEPSTWEDSSLVQLWGPRFNAYIVAARDRGVFTLGRLPADANGRHRAEDTAARLHAFLDGRRMRYDEAGRGLGIHPNALRYAAPTGTVLMRWDGARLPVIWTVPRPEIDPHAARLELARRYLHIFGPTTPAAFCQVGRDRFCRGPAGVRSARRGGHGRADTDRRSVDPGQRRAELHGDPLPGSAGSAPPERRCILPARPGRSRAPAPRRKPATRALDTARLARRGAGRRRCRRDMATSEHRSGDPNVATPLHGGTPSRRAEAESLPLSSLSGQIVVHWDETEYSTAEIFPSHRLPRSECGSTNRHASSLGEPAERSPFDDPKPNGIA